MSGQVDDWRDYRRETDADRPTLAYMHDSREGGIGVIYDPDNPDGWVAADDEWVVEIGGGER